MVELKCRNEQRWRKKDREGNGHSPWNITPFPLPVGLCYEISGHFLFLEWLADNEMFSCPMPRSREKTKLCRYQGGSGVYLMCSALGMGVAAFLNILSCSQYIPVCIYQPVQLLQLGVGVWGCANFPLFNSPFLCSCSARGSMCDKVYWPHHPESIVQTASLLWVWPQSSFLIIIIIETLNFKWKYM